MVKNNLGFVLLEQHIYYFKAFYPYAGILVYDSAVYLCFKINCNWMLCIIFK